MKIMKTEPNKNPRTEKNENLTDDLNSSLEMTEKLGNQKKQTNVNYPSWKIKKKDCRKMNTHKAVK